MVCFAAAAGEGTELLWDTPNPAGACEPLVEQLSWAAQALPTPGALAAWKQIPTLKLINPEQSHLQSWGRDGS